MFHLRIPIRWHPIERSGQTIGLIALRLEAMANRIERIELTMIGKEEAGDRP